MIVLSAALTALAACGKSEPQVTEGWEQSVSTDARAAVESAAESAVTETPVVREAASASIGLIVPTEVGLSAQEEAVITNAAKVSGYAVKVYTTDGDAAKQAEAFRAAIEAKESVIICDNVDSNETAASVLAAKESGIPTILMNRGIDAGGDAAAQILTDRKSCIARLAEIFADQIGLAGKYSIIYTEGNAAHEEAAKAFEEAMASRESITSAGMTPADEFNREAVKETIRQLLTEDSAITALVCANGMQARAASEIVEETGKELTVICLDGNDDEISTMILSGRIFAAIVKPAEDLAGTAMKMAIEYLKNGQITTNGIMYYAGVILTPSETIVVSPAPTALVSPSPVPSGGASENSGDENGETNDDNGDTPGSTNPDGGTGEDEGGGSFDIVTPNFDYQEGELNPEGMEGRPSGQ